MRELIVLASFFIIHSVLQNNCKVVKVFKIGCRTGIVGNFLGLKYIMPI